MTRLNEWNSQINSLGADSDFMSTIFFSDEATFHVLGKVNRHNVQIWGSQNPHTTQKEHVRDSFKLNVWCSLSQNKFMDNFSSLRKLSIVPHILTCWSSSFHELNCSLLTCWSSSSFHKLNNCSLTSISNKLALLHLYHFGQHFPWTLDW